MTLQPGTPVLFRDEVFPHIVVAVLEDHVLIAPIKAGGIVWAVDPDDLEVIEP